MTGTIRVLHVDDDPEMLVLTASYLERLDDAFAVDSAADTETAFDRLDEADYDCLVSDHLLADAASGGFVEGVHDRASGLPLVRFTGLDRTAVEARADGAVAAHITKTGDPDQFERLAGSIRSAVESAPASESVAASGSLVLDANGDILTVSPGAADLLGRSRSTLVGSTASVPVHPDDVGRAIGAIAGLRDDPGSATRLELRYQRGDGSWLPLEVRARNLLEHPTIEGLVVHCRRLDSPDG